MRTRQLEHLRPREILEEKARRSIIYLPLGPLEWHNPANPYGTDGFLGHRMALGAAQATGGVVLPPLFVGSDCPRPPEQLEILGFADREQYIVGMDFPNNSLPSFYLPAEVVALLVRAHLELLARHHYRLIVVVNAHGAATQNTLLSQLCREFSSTTSSRVISSSDTALLQARAPEEEQASIMGHANLSETAMMLRLYPEDVDLGELPPREERLRYEDYGIVDRCVLFGGTASDGFVVNDPRDATPALGEELLAGLCGRLAAYVNEMYQKESG